MHDLNVMIALNEKAARKQLTGKRRYARTTPEVLDDLACMHGRMSLMQWLREQYPEVHGSGGTVEDSNGTNKANTAAVDPYPPRTIEPVLDSWSAVCGICRRHAIGRSV